MTNLSDTQRILLSSASQRQNGSILPLPASVKPGGGVGKAIDALLKRGLVEERETDDTAAVRRVNGDVSYGVFISAAGLKVIGVEAAAGAAPAADGERSDEVTPAEPLAAKAPTKTAVVLALLGRPEGATLPELIAATGWLPHTTRAALTGLRQKGHDVIRGKRGEVTCYSVVAG